MHAKEGEGGSEVHTHVGRLSIGCQVERSLSAYTHTGPGDVYLGLAQRLLAYSAVAGGAHFSFIRKHYVWAAKRRRRHLFLYQIELVLPT